MEAELLFIATMFMLIIIVSIVIIVTEFRREDDECDDKHEKGCRPLSRIEKWKVKNGISVNSNTDS